MDDLRTFESIAASAVNDFEDVVFERHPDRRRIKQLLAASGALHALLTGTGSARTTQPDRIAASARALRLRTAIVARIAASHCWDEGARMVAR